MKVAVVTPYYREASDVLMQCHASVLSQTFACSHILVADGHPVSLFDTSPRTDHVILPRANGDNGNTPRGIGSLLASSEGFDAVAYLDADNWFAPEHIANLVRAAAQAGAPVAASKRTFHALDGALLPIFEIQEEDRTHIDTSCYMFMREAFDLFQMWFMPKALAPVCDRVMFQAIVHRGYKVAFSPERTVAFRSQYAVHYQGAGLTPPPGAKWPSDFSGPISYVRDTANHEALRRQFGFIPG